MEPFILSESSTERLSALHDPASGDLVAAAECMPLFDAPSALASFAHSLRPGGTSAIWFYGRPAFAELEFLATSQPLYLARF